MRRGLRLLGIAAAVVAGVYFLQHAADALDSANATALASWRTVAAVAAMLVPYLAAVPLAALAWRLILVDMDIRMPRLLAYAIVALTQFGKYLPGNFAHHVGRVVVARRFDGDLARLSLSVVYENVIALLAGAHVTAAFLVWRPVPALEAWLPATLRPWLLLAVTLGAALTFLFLPGCVAWLQRVRAGGAVDRPSVRLSLPHVLTCYGLFMASFLVLGVGFTLLAQVIAPTIGFPFFALCGAFAAAWVIGLLVPGAPAGLGIREGTLLVLLADVVGDADAVVVIALLRVATTLGDLVQFAIGGWLMRRLQSGAGRI